MEAGRDMASSQLRHISTTIKTMADRKKDEEDKAKKMQTGGKKLKAKLPAAKGEKADMFADYGDVNTSAGGAGGYEDDEFM